MRNLFALAALVALQGCASMAGGGTPRDFSSLKLFGADGQPGFVLDLACAGRTADQTTQCTTVRHAFIDWSGDRRIRMHDIDMDDPLFSNPSAPAGNEATVAVRFQPDVIPSYDEWHGTQGNMSSGHVNGRVGYDATVYVFSASGALIRKTSLHEHTEVPDHTNVTPYIKANAQHVIALIDPGYPHPRP